jgi:hypothetical protein
MLGSLDGSVLSASDQSDNRKVKLGDYGVDE